MRTPIRSLAIAVALFSFFVFSSTSQAGDGTLPVKEALTSLKAWLGPGPNADAWGKYLHLDGLEAQLAKPDKPDPAPLAETLKALNSNAPGLDLAPFAQLRSTLDQWSQTVTISQAPNLSDWVLSGGEASFRPVTPQDATAAKAKLLTAVGTLDQYLARNGAFGKGWREFLRWDKLEAQLKSDTPDVEVLQSVQARLADDQNGLEKPVFFQARKALAHYLNTLAATKGELRAEYGTQLKGLSEELKQYTTAPSDEVAQSLGARLQWLENSQQLPALVQAVRQRYSHPNLQVRMSARLVAAGVAQNVDEVAPVTDNILGTSIHGTGHTVGRVEMKLIPSEGNSIFETVLLGTTTTNTVGYNGPATIYTNGTTQIRGSKRIVFDRNGFASYPATATATTASQIAGVGARCGLVEKIATKKVYQSKSEAEQIGSSHAADRVRDRVERQVAEQLSKAQGEFVRRFRNPLVRREEFPEVLNFQTTPDTLLITALQANRRQIGAPTPVPAIEAENDLAVVVHESMINNLTAAMLSGVTLKEADVQKQAIDALGRLPEALKSEEDRDPWSITFAKSRPVTVKFTEGGLQITVRGQRYTSGDRDFRAMNVTADYKIEGSGATTKLVRQGDLQIMPPNFAPGQRLSTQQVTLKTLLQRKFGKLFAAETKTEGLVLPGRWRDAGRLDVKQIKSSGGWLVAAWIESGEPAPPLPEDEKAPADPKNPVETKNKVAQH